MVSYMKTTIEISNSLLSETRKMMQKQHKTLHNLVEEGLRLAIVQHQEQQKFHLKDASFQGEGLQPEMEAASWETIRGLIYEGRGG